MMGTFVSIDKLPIIEYTLKKTILSFWSGFMIINYDYYKIFYYVAKYKSFTQAANVLYNNQPNITRSIKNLERDLNCTLFIRNNRMVSLTPEGEKLYKYISVAIQQIEQGEKELVSNQTLQSGQITIGVTETSLHVMLLSILNKFRKLYPNIVIKLISHSTPETIQDLTRGLVDFALVTTPFDITNQITQIKLKGFREILVCGKSFAELQNRTLTLNDLCRYPMICCNKQSATYQLYRNFFLKNGLEFKLDIEVASSDQILPMVINGLGIGFVPQQFAEKPLQHEDICQLKLQEPIPKRYICLLKSSNTYLNVASKRLETMLIDECQL